MPPARCTALNAMGYSIMLGMKSANTSPLLRPRPLRPAATRSIFSSQKSRRSLYQRDHRSIGHHQQQHGMHHQYSHGIYRPPPPPCSQPHTLCAMSEYVSCRPSSPSRMATRSPNSRIFASTTSHRVSWSICVCKQASERMCEWCECSVDKRKNRIERLVPCGVRLSHSYQDALSHTPRHHHTHIGAEGDVGQS